MQQLRLPPPALAQPQRETRTSEPRPLDSRPSTSSSSSAAAQHQHFATPLSSRRPSIASSSSSPSALDGPLADAPSASTSTSSTATAPSGLGVPSQLPKKNLCEACPAAFARRNDLVRHARVHTGEMPFECKKCGMRFRRSDARKRHELKGSC
ncbi:C2H2-type zinc finger protein [Rhodotorula paludigena]|uniref:C2H2-type zinc finger protein n=1 Tax=Rhodotorula paludigena TaxID=86838 RepID=UPI0031713E08